MQNKKVIKLVSVFLCIVITLTAATYSFASDNSLNSSLSDKNSQSDTSQEQPSESTTKDLRPFEDQLADIQNHIAEMEQKIKEAEQNQKVTLDYINLIDSRIGYLNKELTLYEDRITELETKINELNTRIAENQSEIAVVEEEVGSAQSQIDKLQEDFDLTYAIYCRRARAMYISGDFSILSVLLTSDSIATLLTRIQMISEVSTSDADLMQKIENQTEELILRKDGLAEKQAILDEKRTQLANDGKVLENSQSALESSQQTLAIKKAELFDERVKSDELLYQYSVQTGYYTEYKNIDEKAEASVQADIDAIIAGADRELTTYDYGDVNIGDITKPNQNINGSDAVLNMTYPVPSHKSISAGFPNYSDGTYHGGIDFPCPIGSKVVAAQSGTVIAAKKLKDSYGYYILVYHGKDAKGNSVVTLYGHNSKFLVSVGDTVKKGQQIAKSGSTGTSTGPHCHFEVRINGERVNPKHYLN